MVCGNTAPCQGAESKRRRAYSGELRIHFLTIVMSHLLFICEAAPDGAAPRNSVRAVVAKHFVIAGWTGRDAAAIRHHIRELEEIGVPAPSQVPLYYRASSSLLTQADSIEVLGTDSSGEAEPVLFFTEGQWWLTVGSDHTDRKVETYSIAVSKQMCAKPVGAVAWRWDDVAAYQDELELSSRILEGDVWVEYQRGTFAAILPLSQLVEGGPNTDAPREGSFVSCGTLGALPNHQGVGIRAALQMEVEIRDPRRHRSIVHRYSVQTLPVVS